MRKRLDGKEVNENRHTDTRRGHEQDNDAQKVGSRLANSNDESAESLREPADNNEMNQKDDQEGMQGNL